MNRPRPQKRPERAPVGPRMNGFLCRERSAVQAVLDGVVWAIAVVVATVLRYDFNFWLIPLSGFAGIIPLTVLSQAVAGLMVGLYFGRWRFGSFEEVSGMVRSVMLAGTVVYVLNEYLVGHQILPRSVIVIAAVLAAAGMGAIRYGWRLLLEARRRPNDESAERVLLFGAGEGGAQAVAAMLRDPDSTYIPVAFLDDDLGKRNLNIMGVPVVGTRSVMEAAARRYGANTLLIAIPSAEGSLVSELTSVGLATGLNVLVLPPVKALFGSGVVVADLREVSDADILGRHGVETDVESIAEYLTGKRILVTGAGGSIGSELCRQILRFEPAELIMVDRDESALHGVQLSIEGRALLDSPNLVLLDIRDRKQIELVFRARRPDVVFHAAALKHLALLENHPGEAIKTNVLGTLNLLEVAAMCDVERFVNISTDKAADPISMLGYSKRAAERLSSWYAQTTDRAFLSVRFGNVLGSRGSVLGTFHAQIANGGPVTVTSPEVTRFFMTVQEAVQLVIQAGAIGKPGEVLVLDMGSPVRIADIARTLVERAGGEIEIVYTGLRQGEKLHEVLLGARERHTRPVHPMISHVQVPPLAPTLVDLSVTDECDAADVLRSLSEEFADKP